MKLSLLVFLLLCGVVSSQCPSDDGFAAGNCCSPAAAPSMPLFPNMTINGLGACMLDCGVESQFNTTATLAPVQVLCDHWIIGLSINSPAFTITNQFLVAKYARTWIEVLFLGAPGIQVWRFLVNGDLVYTPTGTASPGCPIPLSALPPHNLPVHVVGHVDFAFNCGLGTWECAYALTHFCPTESHASISARPLPAAAGFPSRTYHFVGPDNFNFGICPVPSGNILAESARTSVGLADPTTPYTCFHETQLGQGTLQHNDSSCACASGTAGPPPRYTNQLLNATDTCGTASGIVANVLLPNVPTIPTGLRALVIGHYVAAAGVTYPGAECISVYLGVLDSPGLCASSGFNVVTGVGTTGGLQVILFNAAIPPFFQLGAVDLQNVLVLTPFGFVPGFGALFASERVWNLTTL